MLIVLALILAQGIPPQTVTTPGKAAPSLVGIQGAPGGLAVPVSGTVTAANASVSAIPGATPASGTYAGVKATAAAPTHVEGNMVPLSVDLSGALRTGAAASSPDVTDRAARLLGVVYGSQGQQLKQTATNFNLQSEFAVGGTLIDPRAIRALTVADIVGLGAGSAIVGKVGIDQTTPGTTNAVSAGQGGTWTVQPGNTANTTPWLASVHDGTNKAAVKAASTAAAATDPSLVVNISPNSPAHPVSQSGTNWTVNVAQIGGVATSMGNGVGDTGTQRVTLAQNATYSSSTVAKTATAAGTGPFFTICGSATKTIKIQQILVSGTVATTAVYADVVLKKTSAATSAGTATALTKVPHDSNSAAATANLVNYYTVLATAGTLVGVVQAQMQYMPVTATITALPAPLEFKWRDQDSQSPVLRGIAQCMEASFGTTTTNAPTLTMSVKWTEE